MKYYILAGEASGDLHGSNLIKEIKRKDSDADIRCYGGDLMEKAGAKLVGHYKERAFMGFVEVIQNLFKILRIIKLCKQDILEFQPDALIFIDNSGYNLRIATWAKKYNFKTFYYISPQVWASRASRVKKIKECVDYMYVVLPFVKDFYEKYNYEVTYVGHPLIDAIAEYKLTNNTDFKKEFDLTDKPIIALLPGSRKQEIAGMLGEMLKICELYPQYQFIVAGAPSQDVSFYKSLIRQSSVKLIKERTYDILRNAEAALVTSGTATLETALFKVPQVVCYKGSALSYAIAKRIVKLKYISLVNLIMDKQVVTELIQDDFSYENLRKEFEAIINQKTRKVMLDHYEDLEKKLGGIGASEKTANSIISNISA